MAATYSTRTLRTIALSIAGLSIMMLAVGIFLGIFYAAYQFIDDWAWITVFRFLNTIINSLLAVLIISRHPRHTIGWLFLAVGFFISLAQFQSGLVALAHGLPIRTELTRALITLVGHMAWVPWLLIPVGLVLQFFPDGRLLSPRWWPFTAAVILGMVGFEVSQAMPPWNEDYRSDLGAPNPWGLQGTEGFFDLIFQISVILFGLGVIGTWVSVGIRFHRSRGIERAQMKWLVYTAGITILSLAFLVYDPINPIVIFLTDGNHFDPFVIFVLPLLFPIGISIAILRHHLFDIDIIIQRTLVYGILSVLTVVTYIVIVGGLNMVFQTQANAFNGLVAAGILAVLFQPLRERLQRSVNRLLFGERDDPAAVLTQLVHHLETASISAAILPNLVYIIAQSLKIPHVAIWLPVSDNRFDPVAVWGESPDHVEMLTLSYQNESIGKLVVAPRGRRESFNNNEWKLLNTIAALTAITVRAVQLSDDLRHSRSRIVAAREEERRRLRRDLHDSLGPQLASQLLEMEAMEHLLPTNPAKAQELLSSLQTQAQEAILDIRRLVYDLRPPALDDLGLVGALRQSASRLEYGTLHFVFDVPESLPELPAAVETAVYRITQEAMTNVVRHAQATTASIHLRCTDNSLLLEIRDNGQGLSQEHYSGVGLQSMKERAAELNGQCLIESSPGGGTKIQAQLPLEAVDD